MTEQPLSDFRDNLYIDRDHPIFQGSKFIGRGGGPTKKMRDLRSPRSEDAVTWSVFRTLGRLDPGYWVRHIMKQAFPRSHIDVSSAGISFWQDVSPPAARLEWMLENLKAERIAESEGAKKDKERLARVERDKEHYLELARAGRLRRGNPGCLEGDTEIDVVIELPNSLMAVVDLSP